MKKLTVLLLWLAATCSPAAVNVGDTYAQVLQEKGLPAAKVEVGATHILHYPDQVIRIKDGLVIEIARVTPANAAVPVAARLSASSTPASTSVDSSPAWLSDYAGAMAQAKEQNRHVFLFFTGSDWCGWCKRLQSEILTTPEFRRYAQDKLVLVELDFPRKRILSSAIKAQNAKLAAKYAIEGYPTVIVLDSSGKKIGELGYQEGGPGPFVEKLDKL
jgi:thiol-disulfide isomerase/thioredoxin